MERNNEFEFLNLSRFKLTERRLNEICDSVKERYGLDVKEILETDNGYVFKGNYGFTIGDVTYDTVTGTYRPFNFHRGVVESIRERDEAIRARRAQERKRKYKVQRNVKIGTAITAAGLVVLVGLGVVKGLNSTPNVPDSSQVGIVSEVEDLQSIRDVNDLILIDWANFAINGLSEACDRSEYEFFKSEKETAYANLYVPIMSNYYNYLDMIDSGLPQEMVGSSIQNNHDSFRNSAYSFNDYLGGDYFSEFEFKNTPFASAIVVDSQGRVVDTTGEIHGELVDGEGKVITFDDSTAKVYVKASAVPGQNYDISSLPEDAVVFEGEAYVAASHLNDKEVKVTK